MVNGLVAGVFLMVSTSMTMPLGDASVTPNEDSTVAEALVEVEEETETLLGTYKITWYCPCAKCCGKSTGITSSGTHASPWWTVACNSLPAGTHIRIDGHEYVVEDTGNLANNVIDIFIDSHQQALENGVSYKEVYLIEE